MRGVTLNDLLEAAASGEPYNSVRLGREAKRYSESISRARARDLDDDLHEDVGQEAFSQFWKKRQSLPVGKTHKQVFRACVLAAIRTVRAQNARPGQRTRPRKDAPSGKVAACDIGQAAMPKNSWSAQTTAADNGLPDLERVASVAAKNEMASVEHAIDVERILRIAPRTVATALRLVYFEDMQVARAAASVNLSRFALNRQIASFATPLREAA